jgi:hypothetical protein
MFVLNAEIKIGNHSFNRVNEVTIMEDLEKIGTTATIRVPMTAVLQRQGKYITEVETTKQIKVGDKVTIQLGYNGALNTEFEGYVRNIQTTSPLSIECEDGIYQLKRKNLKKAFRATTLKALVNFILEGTGMSLANEPPSISFEKFYFKDVSAASALEELKKEYGLTITTVSLNKLYVGLYSPVDNTVVKYTFGKNVIDNDLEFINEKDVRLEIKAVHIRKNNTKVEKTVGDKGGEKRTLYFYNLPNGADLEAVAREEIKKYRYTGFKGGLQAFLYPIAHAGNIVEIEDPHYADRAGRYLVKKVEVSYGIGGARRKVSVGLKVSGK